MQINPKQRLSLFLCAGLVLITFALYWPVRNYEFIRYDDDVYVTLNTNVLTGLTLQNVKWAFTAGHVANWHPLTWLSLMLDCTLFGAKPGPMHLVNVAFHVANTLLLFIVFNRMTGRIWLSAFVAALFALHPLHVESVAWVAERKDVLSTFFWLLTMLAYVRYVERPSNGRYAVTLVALALGLMSKPMLVTLPFVLLLLDYWPLNRIRNPKSEIRNLILEKLPLLFLAAVSGIITCIVQQKGGAMSKVPFSDRVANASCSYLEYIGKLFVPVNLAVFYPHPTGYISLAKVILCSLLLILISVFLLYYGRQHRYLAFGWLWYLGTLVPVIGIVQVGAQGMADRYTYIPFIGLFIIIAFGAPDLLKTFHFKKIALTALSTVSLIACIIVASIQLKYWQNSILLFEHTLSVIESDNIEQNEHAESLIKEGKLEEAARLLTEKIRSIPSSPDIHNNLGNAFRDIGKTDEAIVQYLIALHLNPIFSDARYNLALALAVKGDYDKAVEQYKIYLGPNANVADLYQDLARLLAEQGRVKDAVEQLQKALAVDLNSVEILGNLGYALAQSGKPDQALEYYYKALRLDPNNVLVHGRLALALGALGKTDEAIEHCRIVLKARPDDVEMHNNLGILMYSKGRLNEAADSFKKALQIDPNFQSARDNLDALIQKQQQN